MRLALFILFLSYSALIVKALKCYTCTYNERDLDTKCITDPENVQTGTPITSCKRKYCTSIRKEYLDPPGKIADFYRGCENDMLNKNTVIDDGTFKMWNKACRKDFCNGSDGKDIGDISEDEENGIVLYVPGTGYANALRVSVLCLSITLFVILI